MKLIVAAVTFTDDAYLGMNVPKGFTIKMDGHNEFWVPIHIESVKGNDPIKSEELIKSICNTVNIRSIKIKPRV